MTTFLFDGSFDGLLTAVFEFYDRKAAAAALFRKEDYVPTLLNEDIVEVVTDPARAQRVWKGMGKRISKDFLRKFYCAYLSEQKEVMHHLFSFACHIFVAPAGFENNYSDERILSIAYADKIVNREKHRMKAFIRFQKSKDELFFSVIKPDFNVLPLISRHFKERYADQKWLIYDEKRKYGLYYDLRSVQEITLQPSEETADNNDITLAVLDEKEELYSLLWKDYFKHTNIESRKNLKLHIQHVPKRYWRYLTEKAIS